MPSRCARGVRASCVQSPKAAERKMRLRWQQALPLLGRLDFARLGPDQIKTVGGSGIGRSAHASDGLELVGIDSVVFPQLFSDVETEHFAEHETAAQRLGTDVHHLEESAFQIDFRFLHPRRCTRSLDIGVNPDCWNSSTSGGNSVEQIFI